MKRRKLINRLTGATLGSIWTSKYALALEPEDQKNEIKVGLITDLHFGNLAPDGIDRFKVFKKAVERERPDHVIQLGDFCFGEEPAKKLMNEWNAIQADKYHVLGNHDMDKDTKAEIQKFWGMKSRYYHFDQSGWRFIVLDMNHLKKGDDYIPYGNANFYLDSSMLTWPDPEQLTWLDATLAESKLPIIIYTHQPLGHRPDSPQQRPILDLIKKHTTKFNRPKTRAVICGHQHKDWHLERDGVHHICINSASYLWKDGKPWPYTESLFTFMEIKNGALSLTGMKTTWKERPDGVKADPAISERHIALK
ncbi:metallophosphoesterase [Akkermansiaceae bacterium]|nr:metallophosphoesterase [Akkermansiaceae bacterium]